MSEQKPTHQPTRRRAKASDPQPTVDATLRQSEERFRMLAESAADFIYIIDRQGRIEYLNSAAAGLFGRQPEEVIGRRAEELFAPDTFERQQQNLQRVFESDQPLRIEAVTVVGEREIWQDTSLAPLQGTDGQVRAVMGISRDITARKRGEQALQESSEKYRMLVENINEAIYATDSQGLITYASPAIESFSGYSPSEVLGQSFATFIHPEDLPRVRGQFAAALAGRGETNEYRIVSKTGEVHWVRSSSQPLERDGQVLGIQGVVVDVTASRRAEEALQASEMQYRTTIDAMRDPIHVVGPDLRLVLANTALRRWVEELHLGPVALGQSVFDLFPFLPERVGQEYRQVFASGEVLVTEEHTWVGEHEFITETRKIPVFEEGQVVRVVTVIHDITARRQALERLRESEERYRTLVETSPDAIVFSDMAGKVTMVNQEAIRLYGCQSAAEMIGQETLEFIAPRDRERAAANIQRTLESGQIRRIEYDVLRKDSSTYPAELSASLVRDADGRPAGFIGVLRDMTERRRLEEQFRQAQKMETVGRLAGGIAHDFNNLLTAIRGYAGLSHEALRPGDPARDDIEQVVKAAERAAALTAQLLAFSRRQVIEPRLIDLNELILDMDRMLRRLIGEPIELVVRPAAEPCLVRVDPGPIEQAFVNLVVNARDAMPDGGTLAIETAHVMLDEEYISRNAQVLAAGPYIRLSVSDTGLGMSDEVKGHLFEPFFTTKEMGQGTGLGLATVYGIVQQHQGHVEAHSELGLGTTFTIFLPQAEGEPGRLGREEDTVLPRGGETVLVVEDDQVVRALMVRVLRRQGYRVLEATNGNEALRLVQRHGSPVHLLLTDAVLPQMNGKTLAGLLRDLYPSIRVLYVSGYAADVITERGTLQKGVELLQKPFSAAALARKVREVLDAGKQGPRVGGPKPGGKGAAG